MKIFLVDNYDSFTYNLLHYLEGISQTKVEVYRNDELEQLDVDSYSHIVLSPGPGLPHEAGGLMAFIERIKHKKILGVCLGQQAIAASFGVELEQLSSVVHGQSTRIFIQSNGEGSSIFENLPDQFKVGRYHSWVIKPKNEVEGISITSVDEHGHIMSIQHNELDITAVQFHPESILTEYGREMIENWLNS